MSYLQIIVLGSMGLDNNLKYVASVAACGAATGLFVLHYLCGVSFRFKTFTTPPPADTSQPKFSPKFQILSQNTWCLPFLGGRRRRQRLQILINKIKEEQPAFVCLQELFLLSFCGIFMLCGDLKFVHTELVKLGYISCTNPKDSLPTFFGLNSGLMIYSKYALETSGSFEYDGKELPFPKSLVCRGLTYAIYKVTDSESLLIVNTHFENAIRSATESSINALAKYMRESLNCKEIKYVAVMGDFNICSHGSWELDIVNEEEGLYSKLATALRKECGLKCDLFKECERSFRYELTERPNATYDHMFVNDALKRTCVQYGTKDWNQNGLDMSDHLGLMAHFDLLQM